MIRVRAIPLRMNEKSERVPDRRFSVDHHGFSRQHKLLVVLRRRLRRHMLRMFAEW